MRRLRKPAYSSPVPPPAPPLLTDPTPLLDRFYNKVWREQMHDMPFVNPALQVEVIGFQKIEGDWVGAIVTPWFINLFLLPGGGTLWQDLPSGEQRSVVFPAGSLDFIADNNPNPEAPIAAYQYCPLINPVQHLPDHATARQAAIDALAALMQPPPVEELPEAESTGDGKPVKKPEQPDPARRAFLRGRVRSS